MVVLGMHKSGTTLVSRLLHHAGIDMLDTDDDRSYDQGNQYERTRALVLNDRLLGSEGVESIAIRIRRRPCDGAALEAVQVEMRSLVDELTAAHDDWGFKDPRTCLTYGCWKQVLPPHALVAVMRSPQEVWLRYRRTYRNPLRRAVRAWRVADAWTQHNLGVLAALEATTMPNILLDYRLLVTGDGELRRLSSFVGRSLVDERRPDLYRNRGDRAPLFDVVATLYRLVRGVGPRDVQRRLEALRATSIGGEAVP